jgi:hypothetical protein
MNLSGHICHHVIVIAAASGLGLGLGLGPRSRLLPTASYVAAYITVLVVALFDSLISAAAVDLILLAVVVFIGEIIVVLLVPPSTAATPKEKKKAKEPKDPTYDATNNGSYVCRIACAGGG